MRRNYFGTDGVRGIANKELTPELAFKLGRMGGAILTKHSEHNKPKVLLGRDTRISGQMLEASIIAGLLSIGIEVLKLGVIPTPGVAYLVRAQQADAGIQITASHNPAEDNGIKFFGSDGFKLSDEFELEIENLLNSEDDLPRPSTNDLGIVTEFPEGTQKYIEFLETTVPIDFNGMKIGIDGANGATSNLISSLFADLEADFKTMAINPDGININDGVGSTKPNKLAEMVIEQGLDAGIAFDGDGDRLIAVDEDGRIIDGDQIMFIIGKYLYDLGRLKKNTIVTTVMSNLGLEKNLDNNNIEMIRTSVGDRYVVEEMINNGYNLGGEQSGHIVFLDWETTGDGLLTALQLLTVMRNTNKKLSELANEMHKYPQKLCNIKVENKIKALDNYKIKETIKKLEEDMGSDGRILVRPSGTQNLLRIMIEANSHELVDKYMETILNVVVNEVGVDK